MWRKKTTRYFLSFSITSSLPNKISLHHGCINRDSMHTIPFQSRSHGNVTIIEVNTHVHLHIHTNTPICSYLTLSPRTNTQSWTALSTAPSSEDLPSFGLMWNTSISLNHVLGTTELSRESFIIRSVVLLKTNPSHGNASLERTTLAFHKSGHLVNNRISG